MITEVIELLLAFKRKEGSPANHWPMMGISWLQDSSLSLSQMNAITADAGIQERESDAVTKRFVWKRSSISCLIVCRRLAQPVKHDKIEEHSASKQTFS